MFLRSIGHRVKPHRITPAVGNERGDIEIKDYVILPNGEDDSLPPRTLVMDVTMTHDRYGRTTHHTNGALTHRVSSTGAPQPDDALTKADRLKIRHYRQIYVDDLIPSSSCLSTKSLRVVSMRTLHVYFSYTCIVKPVFRPENYLSGSVSFLPSFTLG